MSTEKEKKFGKSKIDGNPEKGFIFRLRDGIIANRHLKDGAVSANKLSQDVEEEWLNPKLEAKSYIKGTNKKVSISSDTVVTETVGLGEQKTIMYVNDTQNDVIVTVPNSLYRTPDGETVRIKIFPGGYGEVSLVNIDGTVFIKGTLVKITRNYLEVSPTEAQWITVADSVNYDILSNTNWTLH